MFLDKSLTIALLISAIFHMPVLLPLLQFDSSAQKKSPTLKITYLVPKDISSAREVVGRTEKTDNIAEKVKAPPAIKRKQQDEASVKEEIEIPPELPKEKEQLYLSYYQSIREKIRRFVIENYSRFIACGEVCLYFVLSPEGELREIKIIEEKSSQNQQLKKIAKNSVQAAAPFSPFPKDLEQSQLSFNVIISFEVEN